VSDAVPLLSAPLPPLPPALSFTAAGPPDYSGQTGLPIFDSVDSGYLGDYGAAGRRRAEADGAAPGGLTSAGLPQRDRRASLRPGAAGGETSQATAVASADNARSRLASFQQGSRRARAAQLERDPRPAQDK
jgi:hypothetical protein